MFLTYTYIHTYKHTYMHACMHAYIHTYIHPWGLQWDFGTAGFIQSSHLCFVCMYVGSWVGCAIYIYMYTYIFGFPAMYIRVSCDAMRS